MVSQINPYIGAGLTAKSFAIAIIGGLDNSLAFIVGGLFLGIVESLDRSLHRPDLYRCRQLRHFGAGADRATEWPSGENSMKLGLKLALAVAGGRCTCDRALVGLRRLVQFGINALILATLAQGWNIIGGYTGYPSFGNSVFYGLGGYGVAIAMVQFQLPFARRPDVGRRSWRCCSPFLLGLPVLRLRATTSRSPPLGSRR